jgi:hypothetical protein
MVHQGSKKRGICLRAGVVTSESVPHYVVVQKLGNNCTVFDPIAKEPSQKTLAELLLLSRHPKQKNG